MNKIMNKLILVSILSILSLGIQAQSVKLGHINTQELMSQLPQRLTAEEELKTHAAQLEKFQKTIQDELSKKYEEYLTERETYTDLVKATKEKDLQDLQQRLETYNKTAQQDLMQKENELFQPIIDAIKVAIEEVGKENGFLYIFDTATGNLLFMSTESVDITPLVRKKMGMDN